MSDRSVLVLEPESSGVDVVTAAAGLGLHAHVFDRRPTHELSARVRGAITAGEATHTRLETRSVEAVVDAALRVAVSGELLAVVPGFEYAVPAAAVTAAKLGLPGLDPATAEALRDKEKMKAILSDAGIPVAFGLPLTPATATETDLDRVAAEVGFPAVVKPVDGSGSLWVRRVDDAAALRGYVAAARTGPFDDMGQPIGGRLLVETYVDGPEYSVEGYVDATGPVVLAVTEKQLGTEPHFVEVGHVVRADLSDRDQATVERLAADAVRALRLTRGVFHLEVRFARSGPVVLEIAARLGGDRIHRLVTAVTGRALPTVVLCCLADLTLPPPSTPTAAVAAVRFFTTSRSGRIADPASLRRELATIPGCVELTVGALPDEPLAPATDFRQRFGHLVVGAPDRGALADAIAEADALVATAITP
ncbi:ATP-grasp domain-containing protein [Saccharothrix isguenensis]